MEQAHRKTILVTRHLVDKNPVNIVSQLTLQVENDRKSLEKDIHEVTYNKSEEIENMGSEKVLSC